MYLIKERYLCGVLLIIIKNQVFMRKLYTILMAAAVAITSSAAVRQHAVALPKRLGTPVEQKAVMGLSAAVQTSTKAVDFKNNR